MDLEAFKTYQGFRLLSLAHDFVSQWQTFQATEAQKTISIPVTKNTFPPNVNVDLNVDPVDIQQIYSLSKDGSLTEVTSLFEIGPPDPQGDPPAFTLTANKRFKKAEVETLLVFISFTGQLAT